MPDPEFKILDVETVQDPETLVEFFDDVMDKQRAVQVALGICAVLLLHHLGEMESPGDTEYRGTIRILKEYLAMLSESAASQMRADILRHLLEAQE